MIEINNQTTKKAKQQNIDHVYNQRNIINKDVMGNKNMSYIDLREVVLTYTTKYDVFKILTLTLNSIYLQYSK